MSTERDCHEEMVPTSNNTNGGSQVSTSYKTLESIKYQSFAIHTRPYSYHLVASSEPKKERVLLGITFYTK